MSTSMITKDTIMLVSGGGRGITAACVKQVASQFKCKFILLGRSVIDVELPANYAPEMDDAALKKIIVEQAVQQGQKILPKDVDRIFRGIKASEEIQQTIQDIQSVGGQALYLTADLTDQASLQEAMSNPAAVNFGQVNAILHGAGNLADKLIEKKTLEDFHSVFATKIIGLENLLSVIDPKQLSVLILFSSVVGFYGNAGQSDYAMANDVLNKLAGLLQQQLPACHVMALDWGPWQSGMVTPALARAFERRGIQLISIENGTRFLAQQLTLSNVPHTQMIIGAELKRQPISWEKQPRISRMKRSLSLKDNAFLLDHMIGGNPVLPATCAAGWIINSCLELYPGYQLKKLENYRILKGIVFENDAQQDFQLEVTRQEDSTQQQLRLDVQLISDPEKKLPRYHYKCSVLLTPEIEVQNVKETVANIKQSAAFPKGVELYQNGMLFHGPAFQGVQEILELNDKGCRMRCNLPDVDLATQGQFPVRTNNPYFNDVVVQSILVWTQLKMGSPCLPASLEAFDYYECLAFGQQYEVSMKVRSVSDTSIIGDIEVYDVQGKIYQRLTGLCGTISPQLKRLFAPPERVISGASK
ncbi:MAG: SDR family NAD(P)-dependent oxidoreductase [Anaerolineaceae bacterium]|nr:SDR family NAD(P)-dependent oxidoreductase [Anaerolineaceae bacterium]